MLVTLTSTRIFSWLIVAHYHLRTQLWITRRAIGWLYVRNSQQLSGDLFAKGRACAVMCVEPITKLTALHQGFANYAIQKDRWSGYISAVYLLRDIHMKPDSDSKIPAFRILERSKRFSCLVSCTSHRIVLFMVCYELPTGRVDYSFLIGSGGFICLVYE